jgi:hypothetical protein
MSHDTPDPHGHDGIKPQPAKVYRVQIDMEHYDVHEAEPTGRRLLEIAGKMPPDQFAIYLKPPGGQPRRIKLDERVDLRPPGAEKFVTLPLDQTEGAS